MSSHHAPSPRPVRKFKGVTVIDWDTEPAEERPSQFADSSLYADLLGAPPPRVPAPYRRSGIGRAWLALLAVVALASGGLYLLARLLRA